MDHIGDHQHAGTSGSNAAIATGLKSCENAVSFEKTDRRFRDSTLVKGIASGRTPVSFSEESARKMSIATAALQCQHSSRGRSAWVARRNQ